MDTSENYIRMCEKAKEIQNNWTLSSGDWFYRKFTIFGDELDKSIWADGDLEEINILQWNSSTNFFWKATSADGQSRLVDTRTLHLETCIWLPRQDQLQEMVPVKQNYEGSYYYQHADMIDSMLFQDYNDEQPFDSYEKIWLALVMKERYGKLWSMEKDEWVNNNASRRSL